MTNFVNQTQNRAPSPSVWELPFLPLYALGEGAKAAAGYLGGTMKKMKPAQGPAYETLGQYAVAGFCLLVVLPIIAVLWLLMVVLNWVAPSGERPTVRHGAKPPQQRDGRSTQPRNPTLSEG